MLEKRLGELRRIDPAVLLEVVRQDKRCPSYELLDWTVSRLSDRGLANPEGLFLQGKRI
jgi:hypothetical protein